MSADNAGITPGAPMNAHDGQAVGLPDDLPAGTVEAAAAAIHRLYSPGDPCGCTIEGEHEGSMAGDMDAASEAVWAAYPLIADQAAAAERARILVSDETLHADGSIGPDTAPPWGGDAAYWYRRWLFAVKQLDEEGSQRISAYVGMREHLDEVAADAGANVAADRIRLEERARIRQLAIEHDAWGKRYRPEPQGHVWDEVPFTDLLDAP